MAEPRTIAAEPGKIGWVGRTLTVLLLVLAAAQFARRSPPHQKDSFFWDFSNVYAASRAWLAGADPYRIDDVYRAWAASRHGRYLGSPDPAAMATWAAVHPPSALVMVAPFAALPAVPAHLLWFGFCLACLAATCAALWSVGGLRGWDWRLLMVACLVASAPVEDALESGQLALPACAAVVLAVWAARRCHLTLAGVLLGLATAVKIQIGGPFLLYYLLLRRFQVAAAAVWVYVLVTLVGVVPLTINAPSWPAEWRDNVVGTVAPGQGNDPRPGGPFRDSQVCLPTLLFSATSNTRAVEVLLLAVFLPLLWAFVASARRAAGAATDLLALSDVALLSFLPIYRRAYDAVLLAMLLTWALAHLRAARRPLATVTLVLLSELLVPINLARFVARHNPHVGALTGTWWWQGLVVPHHAWGVLLLAAWGVYLYGIVRTPRPEVPAGRRLVGPRGAVVERAGAADATVIVAAVRVPSAASPSPSEGLAGSPGVPAKNAGRAE